MACLGPDAGAASGSLRLRAALQPRGPAAAVILTDEQVAAIAGAAKTPPVRVTVNGHTFAGRIGRMRGESLLGFNRAAREACGVRPGEEIDLLVELDDAPREVELPPALAEALAGDDEARQRFEALAYSHRKEYARWVGEAKREETRGRRVAEALALIREGLARR
ncbi:MAG TPA: YdeI/OmpD-associated family protein [Capillimicrobium sp.]|jgi:hypothetical protein